MGRREVATVYGQDQPLLGPTQKAPRLPAKFSPSSWLFAGEEGGHFGGVAAGFAFDEGREDSEAPGAGGLGLDEDHAGRAVRGGVHEAHALRVEAFGGEAREEQAELLGRVYEADARAAA